MDSLTPQVASAAKLPILNRNEFDLWKMRIEQYFLMTDYSLWEVILNGDSPVPTRVVEDVAEDVAHMATPSPPPHGISSPPKEPSSPPYQPPCLENDKAAQQLDIVKLKARVKKLKKINMVKSSKLRQLKKDEGIELVANQENDAEVKGRHADKQAELYNLDQDHSSKVLSMQEDDTEAVAASIPIPAAKPKILNIAAASAVSTRRIKGVVPVVDYQIVLIDNKPRYPLLKFTLEQLVNVTRLQVEEESEMSLELLRLKLKLFKNINAAEEITK
nr:hypothetical protein [Tanacetum cinerariifolium]